MKHKPTGRPAGNLKAEIDWDLVDNLLKAGCPGTEIAPHFAIHEDTLYDRCKKDKGTDWSAYMRQKRSQGDSNLRAKQYTLALQGEKSLLIWLGKQRLGQKENHQDKSDTNINLCTLLELSKSGQLSKEAMEQLLANLVEQKPADAQE